MLQFLCLPVYQRNFVLFSRGEKKHQKQHKASKKSRRVCQTSSCICQTSSCICQTSSCICTISGDGDPFFEHLTAAAMLTSTQQIFLLCRQILAPSDHIS